MDIKIPVPYDPKIPGVRCVDAEEIENVDDVTVNIANDDETNLPGQETEGENIELQDLGQDVNHDDLGVSGP